MDSSKRTVLRTPARFPLSILAELRLEIHFHSDMDQTVVDRIPTWAAKALLQPLAIVLIEGILISMLLPLVIRPAVHSFMAGARR